MLRTYMQELRKSVEQTQRQCQAEERKTFGDTRVKCDISLTEQIEALMRTLPPNQRNRPWSMDELVARLSGRYNANPSAGEVGQALRELSWIRQRDWSKNGEGRRVWCSPSL